MIFYKKLKKKLTMISYQTSKRILKKGIIKIQSESILSINSLNRVASSNIYSKFNYPSSDNAAFDGYAISSNDTKNINKVKRNKYSPLKISKLIKKIIEDKESKYPPITPE